MNKRPVIAMAVKKSFFDRMFSAETCEFLTSFADIVPSLDAVKEYLTADDMAELVKTADAVVTCWGTPKISADMLLAAPKLKLIAHAAGSVKNVLAEDFWRDGGRRVTNNAVVMAKDVAQTTLGLMICSLKPVFQYNALARVGQWNNNALRMRYLKGSTVGIIGASMIGREVISLLKHFDCNIKLYDPYVTEFENKKSLRVTLCSLDELMESCDVVSLHAPNTKECYHMINKQNLSKMKDGAVFINTARGALVDEDALVGELITGRISAVIDVTDPEPPRTEHPFRTLPNVLLLPHIGGGMSENCLLDMGENTVNEIYKFLNTGRLENEIHKGMFSTMA